jgi:hypothetical protein
MDVLSYYETIHGKNIWWKQAVVTVHIF